MCLIVFPSGFHSVFFHILSSISRFFSASLFPVPMALFR